MDNRNTPKMFAALLSEGCIDKSDILNTSDGFFLVYKSIAQILAEKSILDFPDSAGEKLPCDRFFDDWFLYAVPNGDDHTCSLLKMREQEHDTEDGAPADGDTPGVTISFISFDCQILLSCLQDTADENRRKLNREINRVVAHRGQRHHSALKRYFIDPASEGAYLVADRYVRHIAAMAKDGCLDAPACYQQTVQRSISHKSSQKFARLPKFIEALNQEAGCTVCDNGKIYIQDPLQPTACERAAILATHTGNTSVHSFAAEVEYHARFLVGIAKVKIPFFGRSIYDSAIRADMTAGDTEFEGPAPFHRADSPIVKRHCALHKDL